MVGIYTQLLLERHIPDNPAAQVTAQVLDYLENGTHENVESILGRTGDVLRHTTEKDVESLQGRQIRADLARAVVNAGWNLTELAPVGSSLEDIFLQLTASDQKAAATVAPPAGPEQPAEVQQ